MRGQRRKEKDVQQDIAAERIDVLFGLVLASAEDGDFAQADYLISCAREIGMKTNVRIPQKFKRLYCKHCYHFTGASSRAKTRVNSKDRRVEVQCLSCGKKMHYPLKT